MKQSTSRHYLTELSANFPLSIEVKELKQYIRFIEHYKYRSLYCLAGDRGEIIYFGVPHDGFMIRLEAAGFRTLEDYRDSLRHHFPDAASYYEGLQMEYPEYEDYLVAKQAGIKSRDEFIKMKEQGYIAGYAEVIAGPLAAMLPGEGNLENPYRLYRFASQQGFTSYSLFKDALSRGFTDAATERLAAGKGYSSKADYDAGNTAGFFKAGEYEKSQELKIRDRTDMQHYVDLLGLETKQPAHDQRVLITLLAKLPPAKKITLKKIEELFKKEKEFYRHGDSGKMPLWFKVALYDHRSIVKFFEKAENTAEYGSYDPVSASFETNELKDRKVLIDANNVAFNSMDYVHGTARVTNLINMVKELKSKGFKDIRLVADLFLKTRFIDAELLPQLNEMVAYEEPPAALNADAFIINIVKTNHCLLVSNNKFTAAKDVDPWTAGNIDYFRLPYKMDKDKVMFSDI